jgi:5-methylthioadenosine/S-adenosylhomocysteine deaminase
MAGLSLAGGTVLTMDERRPFLAEGSVIVDDGAIVDVVEGAVTHGETIDCRGRVIIPGLVDAHAHGLESLFRGAGGELPLLPWIRRTHALMDQLDHAGAEVGARLTAMEMLRGGVTAYLDPEVPTDGRFDGMVAALSGSGIRAGVTLLIEDRGGYHRWSARERPELTDHERGLLDGWDASAPVRPFLGPSVLSAISAELGQSIRAEADQRGLSIAFHCAEVAEDLVDSLERGGGTPVDFAAAIGLLGPTSVLTHGIHLTRADADRVAASGASLVHCPSSNAKLGSGIAPVAMFLDRGVNVALGTDGSVCNDSHDMFSEMRLAALLQKADNRDPRALTAEHVLRMATANGARALGIDAGVLRPGAAADATVVELQRLGSWPTPNVVDSLVFTANRDSVTDVVGAGEVRVRDRALVGIDVPALLETAAEVARQAISDAGLSDILGPQWAQPGRTRSH